MMNNLLFSFLLPLMVSWSDVQDFFSGDLGFGGHVALMGLVIFLFFIFLCLILFGGMISVVAVPILPLIFWLASAFALTDLLIIIGIMVGILFGFALIKWYRR
jgi:hypothetical protein